MRPRLLDPHHDVELRGPVPGADHGLTSDLELETLIDAMAQGDAIVAGVARRLLLAPATDLATLAHRQRVLRDCLARPSVPRTLYAIATQTLEQRKKVYWGLVTRPDAVVHHSLELLHVYRQAFRQLRSVADAEAATFGEQGLGAFLAGIRRHLDDDFLAEVDEHLRALRFRAGVRVGARLGDGNAGTGYRLEPPRRDAGREALAGWWRRLRRRGAARYTYRLPPNDDGGARALDELLARGLGRTAAALASACDDILWHVRQVRGELAFYVGCLTLSERLTALGAATCFPEPVEPTAGALRAHDLYDPGLALTLGHPVVGNDVDADGVRSMIVTGANQGGKTTFLRSLGVAQLMMQCGMFVAARSFRSSVADGLHTHFTRSEDAAMRSGRLDEELIRLDHVVAELRPGSWLLLNESFSSTNEREGSELAHGIVRALTESGVRVLFVTHLSLFARDLHARGTPHTSFLRAERRPDGTRTFRMVEGEPAHTSHGADLYHQLFDPVPEPRSP